MMARKLSLLAMLLLGCGGRSSDSHGNEKTSRNAPFSSTSADDPEGGSGGTAASQFAGGAKPDPTTWPATGGVDGSAVQGTILKLTQEQVEEIYTNACNAWAIEYEPDNRVILWLIDSSSSLGTASPTGVNGAWQSTVTELIDAIRDTYTTHPCTYARNYVQFFPGTIAGHPATPDAPGAAQCLDTTLAAPFIGDTAQPVGALDQLRQRFEAVTPSGETPLLDAYRTFVTTQQWNSATHDWETPLPVILVTDGMPSVDENCASADATREPQFWSGVSGSDRQMASTEAIIQEITAAAAQGMQTLVVATPESESAAQPWLSRAAIAGRTARSGCNPDGGEPYCHARMGQGIQLTQLIADFFSQSLEPTVSCRHEIPQTSADGTMIVNLDKMAPLITDDRGDTWLPTRHTAAAECSHGYILLDDSTLQLCEATCQMLRTNCSLRTQFIFGCGGGPISTPLQ